MAKYKFYWARGFFPWFQNDPGPIRRAYWANLDLEPIIRIGVGKPVNIVGEIDQQRLRELINAGKIEKGTNKVTFEVYESDLIFDDYIGKTEMDIEEGHEIVRITTIPTITRIVIRGDEEISRTVEPGGEVTEEVTSAVVIQWTFPYIDDGVGEAELIFKAKVGDYELESSDELELVRTEINTYGCQAVILHPALGFPGIVDNEEIKVVLLTQSNFEKTTDRFASILKYHPWGDDSQLRNFQATSITIGNYEDEIRPYVAISDSVLEGYREAGFTDIVYIKIQITGISQGMYNLFIEHESEFMREVVKRISPDPVCPLMQDGGIGGLSGNRYIKLSHPFYVTNKTYLNIAHVTDTHIALRWDLLAKRLKEGSSYRQELERELGSLGLENFNNPNDRFREAIREINRDDNLDIILITGDIIDYNRGHNGTDENDLSEDYLFNRNWVYFYELLVDHYKKPIFTILGNHDWRFNPYAPIPTLTILGIPIKEFYSICGDINLTKAEMEVIHENPRDLDIAGWNKFLRTTVDSVKWYSFVINPFYDYSFSYKEMSFLMLDWCKDETLESLPKADNSLSDRQWEIINRWKNQIIKENTVSIVAMHATIYNATLSSRLRTHGEELNELSSGSICEHREEFIKRFILDNESYGEDNNYIVGNKYLHLVLTGHSHRDSIFQINNGRVFMRENLPQSSTNSRGWIATAPLIIMTNSNGLINGRRMLPGYRTIKFDIHGRVNSLELKSHSINIRHSEEPFSPSPRVQLPEEQQIIRDLSINFTSNIILIYVPKIRGRLPDEIRCYEQQNLYAVSYIPNPNVNYAYDENLQLIPWSRFDETKFGYDPIHLNETPIQIATKIQENVRKWEGIVYDLYVIRNINPSKKYKIVGISKNIPVISVNNIQFSTSDNIRVVILKHYYDLNKLNPNFALPTEGYLARDIPRQLQGSTNNCGAFSMAMAMNYWYPYHFNPLGLNGKKIDEGVDNVEGFDDVEMDDVLWTGARLQGDLTEFAEDVGVSNTDYDCEDDPNKNRSLEKLKRWINCGVPIIVIVQEYINKTWRLHYKLLVGYDDNKIMRYNDNGTIRTKQGVFYFNN